MTTSPTATAGERLNLACRPGESPPQALPEPCVNLSIHTAHDVPPLTCIGLPGVTSRSYPAKSPPKTATSGFQNPVSQSNRQNRKIHPTTPPKPEASKSQAIGPTFSHSQDPEPPFD